MTSLAKKRPTRNVETELHEVKEKRDVLQRRQVVGCAVGCLKRVSEQPGQSQLKFTLAQSRLQETDSSAPASFDRG